MRRCSLTSPGTRPSHRVTPIDSDSGPTRDPVRAVRRDVREGIGGKESRPVFFSPGLLSFRWTGLVDLSTSCRDHRPRSRMGCRRSRQRQMAEPALPRERPDSRMYRRAAATTRDYTAPLRRITFVIHEKVRCFCYHVLFQRIWRSVRSHRPLRSVGRLISGVERTFSRPSWRAGGGIRAGLGSRRRSSGLPW
jgi:hypothetical protein